MITWTIKLFLFSPISKLFLSSNPKGHIVDIATTVLYNIDRLKKVAKIKMSNWICQTVYYNL